MAVKPVGPAFQQTGPFPGPGPGHRLTGRVVDGKHIHPIDVDAGHVVSGGPVGNVGGGQGVFDRSGLGVPVILATENHREFPHRRQVHRLVQYALVGPAVAEEGHGDAAKVFEL